MAHTVENQETSAQQENTPDIIQAPDPSPVQETELPLTVQGAARELEDKALLTLAPEPLQIDESSELMQRANASGQEQVAYGFISDYNFFCVSAAGFAGSHGRCIGIRDVTGLDPETPEAYKNDFAHMKAIAGKNPSVRKDLSEGAITADPANSIQSSLATMDQARQNLDHALQVLIGVKGNLETKLLEAQRDQKQDEIQTIQRHVAEVTAAINQIQQLVVQTATIMATGGESALAAKAKATGKAWANGGTAQDGSSAPNIAAWALVDDHHEEILALEVEVDRINGEIDGLDQKIQQAGLAAAVAEVGAARAQLRGAAVQHANIRAAERERYRSVGESFDDAGFDAVAGQTDSNMPQVPEGRGEQLFTLLSALRERLTYAEEIQRIVASGSLANPASTAVMFAGRPIMESPTEVKDQSGRETTVMAEQVSDMSIPAYSHACGIVGLYQSEIDANLATWQANEKVWTKYLAESAGLTDGGELKGN